MDEPKPTVEPPKADPGKDLEYRLKKVEVYAHWATVISAGAAVVSLCIAVFAVWGAVTQIDAARTTQREATARAAYMSYLDKAIADPVLACPADHEGVPLDKDRYANFLTFALSASEQILQHSDGAEGWNQAIRNLIQCHSAELSSDAFTNAQQGAHLTYACELDDLIADTLRFDEKLVAERPNIRCTPEQRQTR